MLYTVHLDFLFFTLACRAIDYGPILYIILYNITKNYEFTSCIIIPMYF